MHRTTIYLPEDQHEGLRILALRMRTTISDLLRFAAEEAFADEAVRLRGAEDPFAVPLGEKTCAQREMIRGLRMLQDRRMRSNRG